MNHFITIVGPQSSGKTTALEYLRKKYPKWHFVEEINPYTIASRDHLGGAYSNEELQIKISEITLIKIRSIENSYNPVSIIESGIGNLIYTRFFSSKKLAEEYFEKFYNEYDKLNPFIIFIDTKPEVSFLRRKEKYIERIKKQGMTNPKQFSNSLNKYEKIIYDLYPHWIKFYEKLPYPKFLIKNSYISEAKFFQEVDKAVSSILSY